MPNPYVNKVVQSNGTTLIDISDTTAVAADVSQGKYFYLATGEKVEGTASGGGDEPSAASSWTKDAETSYQVNTTSTSTIDVATITCSQSIWTAEKIVYVRVRDTAGKRSGYFYGTDTFIINTNGNNQNAECSDMARWIWKYGSGRYNLRQSTGTTVYGVAAGGSISSSSPYDITIQARYNSSYSGTINSTYSVEVYLLDPPTGAPIFT